MHILTASLAYMVRATRAATAVLHAQRTNTSPLILRNVNHVPMANSLSQEPLVFLLVKMHLIALSMTTRKQCRRVRMDSALLLTSG